MIEDVTTQNAGFATLRCTDGLVVVLEAFQARGRLPSDPICRFGSTGRLVCQRWSGQRRAACPASSKPGGQVRREHSGPALALCGVVTMKQATALAPGWLDVAVLVGQLSGDALPQIVDMTHQLGQGTGGTYGRALGADGF